MCVCALGHSLSRRLGLGQREEASKSREEGKEGLDGMATKNKGGEEKDAQGRKGIKALRFGWQRAAAGPC